MSIFENALGVVVGSIHHAQGAKTIVYTCAGQSPVTIDAVFDEAYQVVDLATGELASLGPMLGVRLSDLPAAPRAHDTLTVDAVEYKVNDVQRDSEGGARLLLRKG